MIGTEVKKVGDIRLDFASVMIDATNSKEIICQNGKSNNATMVSIISTSIIDDILSVYVFKPEIEYNQEKQIYEGVVNEIRVFTYAETKDQLIEDLVDMIEMQVEDYMENVDSYIKFENQKKMYPYFLRLSHCKDRDDIRRMVFNGVM